MINKLAMATFISNIIYSPFLVRAGGLEPPRLKRQRILSPVCLPIPPRSHDTIIAGCEVGVNIFLDTLQTTYQHLVS